MNTQQEPPTQQPQLFIGGKLIYTGEDWQEQFKAAMKNPENGDIVALLDGKELARASTPLYRQQDQTEALNVPTGDLLEDLLEDIIHI